ncbi:MAG: M28 family peptidase, partial [Bacteroidales bacterium]|nr:M28 family peptidase [Bacteroidales bacterium]
FFLFFFLSCSLPMGVEAQDTVYPKYIMRHLSSEYMHGRGPSYQGDSIAARFLVNELKRLGVKPLADEYYQRYSYPTHSMEGFCRLSFDGTALRPYYDFRVLGFSADFHKVLGITPLVRVPAETLVDNEALRCFLRAHGESMADAVLYIDLTQISLTGEQQDDALRQAVEQLYHRNPYGSHVLLLGVRNFDKPYSLVGANRPADYALVEVLASAVPAKVEDVNIDVSSQYRPSYATQNVCGVVPGRSDSMVVFCAHYDHLGQMGNELLFPGVHDNASGVAAVMELARQATFKDTLGRPVDTPKYTLAFLFFSGEEAGLYGSHYAAEHPVIDFNKVRVLVNVDMFCGGDEGLMVFNAKEGTTKPFGDRLKRLNDALNLCPQLLLRENRPNSDHYPFSDLCPSLYILTLGGPYGGYHSPEDRLEGCGLVNFANYLTFIYSLAM